MKLLFDLAFSFFLTKSAPFLSALRLFISSAAAATAAVFFPFVCAAAFSLTAK
jgi:hypothetical protein